MSFEPIPDQWRAKYLKRSVDQLPADLVAACDQLRAQRKEVGQLRADLEWAKKKLRWARSKWIAFFMAIVGGAAGKGIEVGVVHILRSLGY